MMIPPFLSIDPATRHVSLAASDPAFYSDPNAAYAKLKEIGKGLFGTARQGADGSADNSSPGGGLSDLLGGIIGGTLGNLLQQGLGQGAGQAGDQGRGHGRGLPPPSPDAPQR